MDSVMHIVYVEVPPYVEVSADPLEISSNPDLVMIDGQLYSLESRATRLRDRYFNRIKQASQ